MFPDASQWPPYVLGAIVLAGIAFLVSIWPKLNVLRKAARENRWDHPGDRLRNTLWIAFGQSKMFKDRSAGWMHALIFWGFLILLFRALQFFYMGLFPDAVIEFPGSEVIGGVYTWIKNIVVVLVTLACVYALHRRLVTKPKRLNLSVEGIVILVLILLIMTTDIGFEGAKYGMDQFPERKALFEDALFINYWTHILSILVFLVLLPRTKHFHIITSIPNVFLGNVTQTGNQLSRIDFEDESKETFGVTRIEEFSWKKLLDLHTCTECGRCDVFCPALNSDKPLSPKQFTIDLRDHLNAQTPNLLSDKKEEENQAESSVTLMGGAIQDATVWACTTCGACEEECPVMIEYVNKMVDLRRGLVLTEDRYPKELGEAFKSLEIHSNPWGFPGTQREAWAEGLDVKQWDKNNPTEYLYFVGCNGSFDNRGKKVSESVVRALKSAGVDFSILGNREGCTGDPARRLGNEYLFDMLASKNAETLKEQGVIKVIVHCPHCFNSFKHEYPEFGVKLEVTHHSELLADLIKENKLSMESRADETVVVHDSCYMGRHNKVYEAPRDVLKAAVSPSSVKEVETSRERGTCCGAGGGGFLMEETGTRISHNRVDELMQANPDTIAVSCPFCVLMLEDALKAKNLSDRVKVKDISELLNQ
ncbi:MAG: (Fe-S)-binding protein [Nitrospinaceae bacterium]